METTFDPYGEELGASGKRIKDDAVHAAGEIKQVAAEEIKNLIADVEDLVARLADLNDADVATMRSKVMDTVAAAKETLADRADTLKRQAQRAMSEADDYVRASPWVAVGVAALVGALAGILVARRN
jgi:ElaB protein